MTFPLFETPSFVRADLTRLKQVVINLLSNAIKYNKVRGTVVVDCASNGEGRTRINVTDTGEGLTLEKLAQLYQPFNRLGQESGNVVGTGIGLVVTKRLAELMDGTLGVESTVGVGSKFWCELLTAEAPQFLVDRQDAGLYVTPQRHRGKGQHSLLYVEDNPANMRLVEQLIARRLDITLFTAINGILGIELARAVQPTVILMDIHLPGMSGIEALKILLHDPLTMRIPVVALSANAMPRDIERGLELGFFRYLTKPIKVEELMGTLDEALEFAGKQTEQDV